jgi:hypothetical protein
MSDRKDVGATINAGRVTLPMSSRPLLDISPPLPDLPTL